MIKVSRFFFIKIRNFINKIINYRLYIIDLFKYKYLSKKNNRFSVKIVDLYPCISDRTVTTEFEPHYTYHIAWAARKIAETMPVYHVDISSNLQFSTIVSAFVPVRFYDYRPVNIKLSNLESKEADLNKLPFKDGGVKSLSCMHVVEHIGLGRYGDVLDPNGDLKAISELKRVLSKNGNLFFVVPIGKPRIQFNAHRIYSSRQIKKYFSDLKLVEFLYISDGYKKGFISNPKDVFCDKQRWGCGCFWFKKI